MTELNLANLNHVFFSHVSHFGERYLAKNSPYFKEDFWLFLKEKAKRSNVLIVNHAFLIQENFREFPWLPASDFLIIDEAHHLPDIAEKTGHKQLSLHYVKNILTKFVQIDDPDHVWKKIVSEKDWPIKQASLKRVCLEISDMVDVIQADVVETTLIDSGHYFEEEVILSDQMLNSLPIYLNQDIYRFNRLLQDLLVLIKKGQTYIQQDLDRWLLSEQLLLLNWIGLVENLEAAAQFIQIFLQSSEENLVRWLKIDEKTQNVRLYYSQMDRTFIEKSAWYPRYNKILYTGGTLQIGKDQQYLARSLGLADLPFESFPSAFHYDQQARIYVPEESLEKKELSSRLYEQYVAETVVKVALDLKVNVLVLFTAHSMLQNIYHKIQPTLIEHNIEVLGQGISGSRERIMKRFTQTGQKVLLGADSFWEGIDLPGDALEMIIVARLPFESPERPFVKEKLRVLQEKGYDPFYQYSLPKAILRLRQGIGRLIRTEKDKGALLVLDPRIVQAKYSTKIQEALEEGLTVSTKPFEEIIKELENFL